MRITSKFSSDIKQVKKKLKTVMNVEPYAKRFVAQAKRNTKRFKKRSGKLENSIRIERIAENGFNMYTDMPHARIQDEGGIIRPKQARYLAIPMGTRRGTPRKWSDMVCIKAKGNLFLIQKGTKNFFYVLKKQVVLKGTGWWSDAVKYLQSDLEKMKGKIEAIFK